jgi:hypothetical protein
MRRLDWWHNVPAEVAMGNVLLVVAALIVLAGVTKLQRVESHGTPWGALLVWAGASRGRGLSVVVSTRVR